MEPKIQIDKNGTPFVDITEDEGFKIGLQSILNEGIGDWRYDFDKLRFLSWFTAHLAKLPQHEFDRMFHDAIQEWDSSDD